MRFGDSVASSDHDLLARESDAKRQPVRSYAKRENEEKASTGMGQG